MIKLNHFYYTFLLLIIFYSSELIQAQNCRPTGYFRASEPPQGQCNTNCCVANTVYFTFQCSPTVTTQTSAILTLRSFQAAGTKCSTQYVSDTRPVVALSTGWYGGGSRCGKDIVIVGNGNKVIAKVVDECDSTKGCDAEEGYHPPCGYNIVAASKAVWKALGVPQSQWGQLNVTWSDA